MTKPFKFRYVREIVGSFMLGMIALIVVGVILAGRAQGWFEPTLTLRIRMPEAGLAGIQKGTPVMTLGTKVGMVDKVQVNDDESLEAVLALKGSFIRFVRQDSDALIKKQFGVAGDSYIELTRGVGAPIDSEYLPNEAKKDRELVELVEELVVQVQWAVLPMVEQVRAAVEQYTDLGIDLQKTAANLELLTGNLNTMTEGLNKGEGTAGRLLKDPQTIEEVNALLVSTGEIITNLNAVVRSVHSVVTNVDVVVGDAQGVMHNINRASHGVPGMMRQTESTLQEAEILLDGLQRHWLLKKYINAPEHVERIPAASAISIPIELPESLEEE